MKKHPFIWGIFSISLLTFFFYSLSDSLRDYFGNVGNREKIGVVDIKGVITESDEIIKKLKKYGKDSSVKAILLRINSPGGGVAPSQEIYSEILRIRRERGKKVVASMSSLGASGGYYIACAANKIFANPGTITGSIGVIIPFSNMEGLMGKIGLRTEVIKSGEFKDIGSPSRAMTDKERAIFQASVDDVHSQFVESIVSSRNMDPDLVMKLADGRIYTGRQALEAGLVDKLGGFEDALDLLAEMAGITGEPEVLREKEKKSLFYRLVKGGSDSLMPENLFNQFSGFQYLWRH